MGIKKGNLLTPDYRCWRRKQQKRKKKIYLGNLRICSICYSCQKALYLIGLISTFFSFFPGSWIDPLLFYLSVATKKTFRNGRKMGIRVFFSPCGPIQCHHMFLRLPFPMLLLLRLFCLLRYEDFFFFSKDSQFRQFPSCRWSIQ